MLQTKAVEKLTLELLTDLMHKDFLNNFVLVGGTALALMLGHRKSIDIDLFTIHDFQSETLVDNLSKDYSLEIRLQLPQTLIAEINKIKVDFIRFKYPFIRPVRNLNGIRLLDIEDIAAMKLDAITGRGNKKDFYDLYYLLQKFDLNKLLDFYQEKYSHNTTFHIVRSLTYFVDAENQPDPIVFDKKLSWEKVKNNIIKKVRAI